MASRAVKWLRVAAKKNHVGAMVSLGKAAEHRGTGTSKYQANP